MPNSLTDKQPLRKSLRAERRALSRSQRSKAARQLARHFFRYRGLANARHVALYLALGAELDTTPLLAALHARGISAYVPQLQRDHTMRFVKLARHTPRLRRHHGRRQAGCGHARRLSQMDLVLLPLLGFDRQGHRLGQGGGYYDRALARCKDKHPRRIGVAYRLQERAAIPTQVWDMPLHAVLTENGLRHFNRSSQRALPCATG